MNTEVASMTDEPRVFVGTSGWKKPMWRGHFYPAGLVQRRELEYAVARLSSLEINTTFHGLPRISSYQSWRAETPDGFVFSVKGNRMVTHEHRLGNPAQDVARFFASGILELRERLGPILWQTPPSLRFRPETIEAFLAVLPHSVAEARRLATSQLDVDDNRLALDAPDAPIRHALEVRHSSFEDPAFADLLRRYDVAAVVTNSPGWPPIHDVTSDFSYLRLHGDANHYPDGYDEAALDYWAHFVSSRLDGTGTPDGLGRDVFVYFDNPDNEGTNTPFDAMKLRAKLEGPTPDAEQHGQPALW